MDKEKGFFDLIETDFVIEKFLFDNPLNSKLKKNLLTFDDVFSQLIKSVIRSLLLWELSDFGLNGIIYGSRKV